MARVSPNKPAFDVVHVAETIHGGVGTYLRVLLPYQVERYGPQRVAVVVPQRHAGDLDAPPGVQISTFAEKGGRLLTAWRAYAGMSRLLRQDGAAVVHLHSTFAGFSCRLGLLFRRRRPRVVYCAHGWAFDRDGRSTSIARFAERVLSSCTDAIVCVSERDRQSALAARIAKEKLIVIRNGLPDLDPAAMAPEPSWPDSCLRLVFVGRLDRQKGLDVLLAALARVRRPLHLHVFGERVVGEPFETAIPTNVELHGWADFETINAFLSGCDALVMPSRWEGLPFAAIEAQRAAKAVIASDVGGLPEIIENGATGILVPRNDIAAWTQTLQSVREDDLAAMGARGRKRYERDFTAQRVDRELAALYRSEPSHAPDTDTTNDFPEDRS